jgi:hypothetical protein
LALGFNSPALSGLWRLLGWNGINQKPGLQEHPSGLGAMLPGVGGLVVNGLDSGRDNKFGTVYTGLMRTVQNRAIRWRTNLGTLEDSVGLGMYGSFTRAIPRAFTYWTFSKRLFGQGIYSGAIASSAWRI